MANVERVSGEIVYIDGKRYELKRSYAGKQGALEYADEVRRKGFYLNERRGRARVIRRTSGYWGVFVAKGEK